MRNRETALLVFVILAAIIFGMWPAPNASSQNTGTDTLTVDQAKQIIKNNLDTARQNNTSALNIAIDATKTQVKVEKPIVHPSTYKRDLDRALSKEPKVVRQKEPIPVVIPVPVPVAIGGADSIIKKDGYIYIFQSSPKYGGTPARGLTDREVKGFAGPLGSKNRLKSKN